MKALIIALFFFCTSVFAGVRINGVPPTYATIQGAVTNALPGDTLIVTTGVYEESVNIFNTELFIDGGYGMGYTQKVDVSVIDGVWSSLSSPGSIIDITNSMVILEDMELRDGGFGGFILSGFGGGLDVRAGSVVTARTCTIHNNTCKGYGGGVYVEDSSLTLINTGVENNKALVGFGYASKGGGVYVESGRFICEEATTDIEGNSAHEGGGVVGDNATVIISQNADVMGNIAATRGGGMLMVNGSTCIVTDTVSIIGIMSGENRVTNGHGGGLYAADSTVELRSNAGFWHNFASQHGGAVYLTNSMMTIDNASIGYNGDSYSVTNFARHYGGGVYMIASTLVLTNRARIFRSAAFLGGGICAFNSRVKSYGGSSIGNTNNALRNYANSGGGIVSINSTLEMEDTEISGNTAFGNAGALFSVMTGQHVFTRCRISDNAATGDVAGVFVQNGYGDMVLDATDIMRNHAEDLVGGIAWLSPSTLYIFNESVIASNKAHDIGGLYLGGTTRVENVTVAYNAALRDIGGVYVTGTNTFLEWRDSDLVYNSAGDGGVNEGIGGGIAVDEGHVSMHAQGRDCHIGNNVAEAGGGIYCRDAGRLEMEAVPPHAVRIHDNSVWREGGGMYCKSSHIQGAGDIQFDGNRARFGGGLFSTNGAVVTLYPGGGGTPSFINNSAEASGGGIYARSSNTVLVLTNVHIGMPGQGNIAMGYGWIDQGGGGMYIYRNARVSGINCHFVENTASNHGGGFYAISGAHVQLGSDFSTAETFPPTVFSDNYAGGSAGAGLTYIQSRFDLADAMVVGNEAEVTAGAFVVSTLCTANLQNVVIAGNTSPRFGAALSGENNNGVKLQHCTIADNESNAVANLIGPMPKMENCIVWGNIGDTILTNCDVYFSDIQGGYPGSFVITNDPLFYDAGAMNYQLLAASPCIDAGATLVSITNDCIGAPRPFDGGWDMGAYEFIPEPGMICILAGAALLWRKMT